jgi:lipopolysaccharide biosynthesis protein
VVHAFYLDIFAELLARLEGIRHLPLKLFVTTADEQAEAVRALLDNSGFEEARLQILANRGRDGLPFLRLLPELRKAGCDLVIKVHTKKSAHREDGSLWRQEMYSALLDDDCIEQALGRMLSEPDIGILGPGKHLLSTREHMAGNLQRVCSLGKALGLTEQQIMATRFFAGTMFMARLSALLPLLSLPIADTDFEEEAGQLDGTLAHGLERVMPLCALSAGMRVAIFDGYQGDGNEFGDTPGRKQHA